MGIKVFATCILFSKTLKASIVKLCL